MHFFQNYATFQPRKTLAFCSISVIIEDIYLKLKEYMFTIQRAIHTIKGHN